MSKNLCFEASVDLAAHPREVFLFHSNPENLRAISPSSMRILSITANPRAGVGETFRIKIRQFFLTIDWEGCWESVIEHRLLADSAVRSPFKSWLHEHVFEPDGSGGTRMTDRVTLVPKEGFPFCCVPKLAYKAILSLMFTARHKATKEYFQNQRPELSGSPG